MTLVALIVLQTAIGLKSAGAHQESTSRAIRTLDSIISLERVALALTAIEAAERGFLLVAEEEFLETLRNGKRQLDEEVKRLDKLAAGRPTQQHRIGELKSLICAWQTSAIDYAVNRRRKESGTLQPSRELLTIFQEDRDKERMDPIRAKMSEILSEEEALLEELTAVAEAHKNSFHTMQVAVAIIAVILGLLAATSIARSMSRRMNYMREIAEATADGNLTIAIRSDVKDELGRD